MNRQFAFGALIPPGREWMIGRTVAEIDSIVIEAKQTNQPEGEVAARRDVSSLPVISLWDVAIGMLTLR